MRNKSYNKNTYNLKKLELKVQNYSLRFDQIFNTPFYQNYKSEGKLFIHPKSFQ